MVRVTLNMEFYKKLMFVLHVCDNLLCTVQSVFLLKGCDDKRSNTSFPFIKAVLLKYVTTSATPASYLLHLVSLLYSTAD